MATSNKILTHDLFQSKNGIRDWIQSVVYDIWI